jgi:capsular polysaccharide transport system permease protein
MKSLIALSARRLKLILIVLPVLLLVLYLSFVAADRYVSTSTVAVQRTGSESGAIPGMAMLLAGVAPPATQDTRYLMQYIRSLAMLQKLDRELKLREHFSKAGLDLPNRLAAGATQEDALDYFRRRVDVSFEDASGLLTVRVQAFDPAYAQKVNRFILQESERFVNETSHAIARDQLRFSEGELKASVERLGKAKDQLLAFQNKNRLLDPMAQAQANVAVTAELQSALSRREAELTNMQSFLNDTAPQVQSARNEIKALQSQINIERSRSTTSGRDGERLNSLAADFQSMQMQFAFATDTYKIALGAVENARIEATRKLKTLVVIEPPSLPESAEYPMRIYALATLLMVCLLLYAVVRLVLATIREHQD